MKKQIDIRLMVLFLAILLLGVWRVFILGSVNNSLMNFTPLGAMALFAGTYFSNRIKSYAFPLLILFASDIFLMKTVYAGYGTGLLYSGWYWTYGCFALMVLIGQAFNKKVTVFSVLISSVFAAFAHYLITDFGVWLGGGMDITTGLPYTRDWAGLAKCYLLALPYLKNMLLGNIIFGAALFGGFEFAQYTYPVLRIPRVTPECEKP